MTAAALAVILTGCRTASPLPDLGALYSDSAKQYDVQRNPVIVIPGVLGSKLVDGDTGRVVWGAFAGGSADPRNAQGARLLALPMREGVPLRDLTDQVVPNGALDRLKLNILGLPLQLGAYVNILSALGVGGYRDQSLGSSGAIDYGDNHFTCFQFAYDWRRDLVENAQRLHEFIVEKRAYVQQELARRHGIVDREVKFDIVAHSMGGLVTRYYLLYGTADLPEDGALPPATWAGAAYVERAILVGTPNGGSVDALLNLVDGYAFGPLVPKYTAAILGTMPSLYQLLPHPSQQAVIDANRSDIALDLYNPALWEKFRWGVADPEQDAVLAQLLPEVSEASARRRIALDHQRKCLQRAKQFADALDRSATPPAGLSLYLFAGDAVATEAVVAANETTGRLSIVQYAPGDGRVTRRSALLDERGAGIASRTLVSPIPWDHVTFLFTGHIGLTKDPSFTDNLLYVLLEQPT